MNLINNIFEAFINSAFFWNFSFLLGSIAIFSIVIITIDNIYNFIKKSFKIWFKK